MPTLISIALIVGGTVAAAGIGFWVLTARKINVANRTRQIEALARLGRMPSGAPSHRCSCGHPKGMHPGNGACTRMVADDPFHIMPKLCGCNGWNP